MYRLILCSFLLTDSETELEKKIQKGRLRLVPSSKLETETEDDSYSHERKITKTKSAGVLSKAANDTKTTSTNDKQKIQVRVSRLILVIKLLSSLFYSICNYYINIILPLF